MKRTPLLAAGSIAAMLLGGTLNAHAQDVSTSGVSILQNFGGYFVGGTDGTASIPETDAGIVPPDTMGAVGPNNFVEMLNGGYAVYDKTGVLQATPTTDSGFWKAAGIASNVANSISDPHIIYDPFSQHWYASEITIPASNSNAFLVAVSKDSNPLDGFKAYSYNANPTTGSQKLFADFDMLGYNAAGVYVGANMFSTTAYTGQDILTIDQTALNTAGAIKPGFTLTYNAAEGSVGFNARPVVDYDNGGSSSNLGESFLGVGYDAATGNNVVGASLNTISGTPTAATITTNGTNVTVASYQDPSANATPGAAQLGSTTARIDDGDSRYSSYVVKQGGVIYTTQTVTDPVTGLDDVRVLGISAATGKTLVDQLISSTTLNYYYGSIAINASGQMVIGFSSSGVGQYVNGNAIAGQLAADGKSVVFGSVITTAAGQGTYVGPSFDASPYRWGDYSSTTLDPNNPNDFWTIQEYAIAPNEWSTKITEFGFAAAPEPSQFAALGLGILGLAGLALRARRRNAAA